MKDPALALAQSGQLLKATHPSDFAGIARATSKKGPKFVDHQPDLSAHPPGMNDGVAHYRDNILNSPGVVRRMSRRGSGAEAGVSKKVVYKTKDKDGNDTKYIIKPYYETGWKKEVVHSPLQGWAEMTSQALYHAGGIGHLHQKVHVDEHFMGPGKEKVPALVIHMAQNHLPIHDVDQTERDKEEDRESVRRIALMDFLSNNIDRHRGNLLINTRTEAPLAIDHSLAFQYQTSLDAEVKDGFKERGFLLGRPDYSIDSIDPYLVDKAPNAALKMFKNPWNRSYDERLQSTRDFEPTFEWWGQASPKIREAFKARLNQIRDPEVRAHLKRNFESRAEILDQMAQFGVENFGVDWTQTSVPVYAMGEMTDEEKNDPDFLAAHEALKRQNAKPRAAVNRHEALTKKIDENNVQFLDQGADMGGFHHIGGVRYDRMLNSHPASMAGDVDHFREHVLKTPWNVEGRGMHEGVTPKRVFEEGGRKYLVKDYWDVGYAKAGWAEMASQGLYHAAGIGHLHQRAHVDTTPFKGGVAPMTVIHMQPGMDWIADHLGQKLPPETQSNLSKIHVMDFLTDNTDRHDHNLLITPDKNKVLAIDHGFALSYDEAGEHFDHGEDQAAATGGERPIHPEVTFGPSGLEFWRKNRGVLADELEKHLPALDSTVAENVRNGFKERARMLDEELAKHDYFKQEGTDAP